MNGREMSAALRAGRRVYGTLITSPSPHLPGPLSRCGLDYVFIDTEHVPINDHDLAWMCQTYRAMNLAPIVRISSPDPNQATHVLDAGAVGVVAPYVETVEPDTAQARQGTVPAARHRQVDRRASQPVDHWPVWRRQNLARLRSRAESVPGQPDGHLPSAAAPVRRSGTRPWRRAVSTAVPATGQG